MVCGGLSLIMYTGMVLVGVGHYSWVLSGKLDMIQFLEGVVIFIH